MCRKIVDFHAHAFHDKIAEKAAKNLNEYYGIPLAGNGRFQILLESMEENHIDTLVVHATATKPEQVPVINDYMAGLLAPQIVGFGTLHPDYPQWQEELNRFSDLGLRGVKFHPIFQGFKVDDASLYPIYEQLEGRLPVLMHMGDTNVDNATPERLLHVMKDFPKLTVVAAHLGSYHDCWHAQKCLGDLENLYVDTSSAIRFLEPDEATRVIRAYGTGRVLFGTDYPLSLHKAELEIFDKLALTEEESEQILWKNAYGLLGLSVEK